MTKTRALLFWLVREWRAALRRLGLRPEVNDA
jgi:hypothetical protein